MEPVQIALVAVSAVLFVSLVLWGRTARKGSRARRTAGEARTEAGHSLAQLASVRRGEREAAWTAATATERLQRSLLDLDKAEHEAKRLTADVESLQDQVTHLDGALLGLKQEHSATLDRLGSAESSLETALRRATEGERRAELVGGLESRLEAVTRERDRLSATAHREEQLEGELSALGRVRQELDAARLEASELRSSLAAAGSTSAPEALIAERDDLRSRLDAVVEARLAEQAAARATQAELDRLRGSPDGAEPVLVELEGRVAAVDADAPYAERDRQLRMRIAEAVELATARLQREIDHLRLVVAEKERIIRLRLGSENGPAPAATPSITDIKGIGPKIAAILAEHGMTSVADIAALDDAAIDGLADEMPVYPGRIRADDWVGQARRLLG